MNNSLAEVHPELVSEWSEKNFTAYLILGNGWGYEMTISGTFEKKMNFIPIYWSEYNFSKKRVEVQNFMIRFIIETIMPIYRKGQVNGFTM